VKDGEHVPGIVLHRYLTTYATHFGFYDRIIFKAWVNTAELLPNNEWLINYSTNGDAGGRTKENLQTKKLVLATGTTSNPRMPTLKGSDHFKGQIFHSKELSNRKSDLETAKNIVVLGGSKSAVDAVYMNASKGQHVDWVIRGK
jgi:cation diffusion facilitator CzcD-associated flavoprotein CzcO